MRIREERGSEKIRMKELRESLAAVGDKICQGFSEDCAKIIVIGWEEL